MTLQQRIEQAAGINAATCAHHGSAENNYTVITDLKSTVYALTLELRRIAESIRDGEKIDTDTLAQYAALASLYEFRGGLKSRTAGEGDR